MISMMRSMVTCRWSARRIQRYLDSDPAAPLDAAEVRRLEAHLTVCARCGSSVEEYRTLRSALLQRADRDGPDPQLVARVQGVAERLMAEEPR